MTIQGILNELYNTDTGHLRGMVVNRGAPKLFYPQLTAVSVNREMLWIDLDNGINNRYDFMFPISRLERVFAHDVNQDTYIGTHVMRASIPNIIFSDKNLIGFNNGNRAVIFSLDELCAQLGYRAR